MTDFNNEDGIKRMLKAAYRPVAPSSEFKEQLCERLSGEIHSAHPILTRPKLVIPIIVTIAAGLIGYGVWLSTHLVPGLLP